MIEEDKRETHVNTDYSIEMQYGDFNLKKKKNQSKSKPFAITQIDIPGTELIWVDAVCMFVESKYQFKWETNINSCDYINHNEGINFRLLWILISHTLTNVHWKFVAQTANRTQSTDVILISTQTRYGNDEKIVLYRW